ncbi:MAG: tRNA (adenosine(37)-N6)-threonylcarbamoyltransferase complex ATPase subunit type 1 TsaE [Bacteroidota bacterium]
MHTFQFKAQSEEDNISVAEKILNACKKSKIFAFYGGMGAGKTTFIKSICEFLGVTDEVTSPTFTLVNEYEADGASVFHFDFYRIQNEIEAYDIGSDEYFYSGDWCFIEWPDNIPTLLPGEAVQVRIEVKENDLRELTVIC